MSLGVGAARRISIFARRTAAAALLAAGAAGLVSCGHRAAVVVRVGNATITRPALEHWTAVIERERALGQGSGPHRVEDEQRALRFLITSSWLIGDAVRRGIEPTDHEVAQAFARERESAVSSSEFDALLHSDGKTSDDAKFEIEAQMAALRLAQVAKASAARVTQREIAAFYEHHIRLFTHLERRDFWIVENFASPSAAQRAMSKVGAGTRMAEMGLHESLTRPQHKVPARKAAAEAAIFRARPHTLGGPVRLNGKYAFFVVWRVVPTRVSALREVSGRIASRLEADARRRAERTFLAASTAKWIAQTHCRRGYVVLGCAESRGRLTSDQERRLLQPGS